MSDEIRPADPQEFNVVLESPQLSAEQQAHSLRWLLIKAAMRRQPMPRRTLTISFSDQPDFFIVEDVGK